VVRWFRQQYMPLRQRESLLRPLQVSLPRRESLSRPLHAHLALRGNLQWPPQVLFAPRENVSRPLQVTVARRENLSRLLHAHLALRGNHLRSPHVHIPLCNAHYRQGLPLHASGEAWDSLSPCVPPSTPVLHRPNPCSSATLALIALARCRAGRCSRRSL